MDNVPIETRKCIDAPEGVLDDETIFKRIAARVDEILAETGCKDAAEYLAKLESGEIPDPIPNRVVPLEA